MRNPTFASTNKLTFGIQHGWAEDWELKTPATKNSPRWTSQASCQTTWPVTILPPIKLTFTNSIYQWPLSATQHEHTIFRGFIEKKQDLNQESARGHHKSGPILLVDASCISNYMINMTYMTIITAISLFSLGYHLPKKRTAIHSGKSSKCIYIYYPTIWLHYNNSLIWK